MERKTRAGIYLRLSVDRSGVAPSVERHERDCQKAARERGWTVSKVYSDRDLSGFTGVERPAYTELLSDLRGGALDAVVVWKLDRLTRGGIVELGKFLEVLRAADARFLSVVEPYLDTTSSMGEAFLGLVASIARNESETIRLRTLGAHEDAAVKRRPHMGGTRPYGFLTDRVTHDVVEAEVIRECAERFLQGNSLRSIAANLNARGLRTPTGGEFQASPLGHMLRSPRIAGMREHRGQIYPDAWEPIIDHDTWLALQHALKTSRRRSERSSAVTHLLPGFVRCGVCRSLMKTMGFVMKSGRSFPRYQCVKEPGRPNCGHVAVSEIALDTWTTEVVIAYLSSGDWSQAGDNITSTEISALTDHLSADRIALEELTHERYVDRTIDDASYASARSRLVERIQTNEGLLERSARGRTDESPQIPDDEAGLRRWWDAAANDDRRRVLALCLNSVFVSPAKRRGGNVFDNSRVSFEWVE